MGPNVQLGLMSNWGQKRPIGAKSPIGAKRPIGAPHPLPVYVVLGMLYDTIKVVF